MGRRRGEGEVQSGGFCPLLTTPSVCFFSLSSIILAFRICPSTSNCEGRSSARFPRLKIAIRNAYIVGLALGLKLTAGRGGGRGRGKKRMFLAEFLWRYSGRFSRGWILNGPLSFASSPRSVELHVPRLVPDSVSSTSVRFSWFFPPPGCCLFSTTHYYRDILVHRHCHRRPPPQQKHCPFMLHTLRLAAHSTGS